MVNVSVLLYAPALASAGISRPRLRVGPASAANCHSPWPLPGAASTIVTAFVLSSCRGSGTGPTAAGLPGAAGGVRGVSVSAPPVPAADVEPLTVGSLVATVTL